MRSRLPFAAIALIAAAALLTPHAANAGTGSSQCLDEHTFPATETTAAELLEGRYTFPPFEPFPVSPTPPKPDLDWNEDPFQDPNWRFQLHGLQWATVLFDRWQATGDLTYRDRLREILYDWHADNPFVDPPSDHSWDDHATAFRAMLLACVAPILDPGLAGLSAMLLRHGTILARDDFYVAHGNHALDQSMGLLAIACVVGRPAWADLATSRLRTLAEESIDPTGATNEGAVTYAIYNHEQYTEALRRFAACGRTPPEVIADRLPYLGRFIAHATLPNGSVPLIGDATRGPTPLGLSSEATFAATRGASGRRPRNLSSFHRDGGWAFGRSSWDARGFTDALHYTLRSGRASRIHAHDDQGHLSLYGFGRRLLEDSGFHRYGSALNAYFYRAQAHNVVWVDRANHVSNPTTRLLTATRTAAHDAYLLDLPTWSGVRWHRSVVFSRRGGYLIVADHLNGYRWRAYRQLWHLTPDAAPIVSGASARTTYPRGNVLLRFLGSPVTLRTIEGRTDPMQGFISFEYGGMRPAPVIEARATGPRANIVTVIVPGVGQPSVSVIHRAITADGYDLTIRVRGRTERIRSQTGMFTVTCVASC